MMSLELKPPGVGPTRIVEPSLADGCGESTEKLCFAETDRNGPVSKFCGCRLLPKCPYGASKSTDRAQYPIRAGEAGLGNLLEMDWPRVVEGQRCVARAEIYVVPMEKTKPVVLVRDTTDALRELPGRGANF